ncbi:60S ribosomal protein L37a-2-like [Juglans microcarpa x Juglans regia]|uniref:60S ribosomal protein L37a-2-like n=1 Tax=Juglans microcarpa x Juglans regia TaxID=2249226 RepID=UPI001B7F5429|nr:60S ribosomal protein L37a-2-like [Juglans microcarpa x Juglans regia]
MTKRTKMAGIVSKYGTRDGASLKKQIKKIEVSQHSKYFCEFFRKFGVKRKAVGICGCKDYGKVKAGCASTMNSASVVELRSTLAQLKEEIQGNTDASLRDLHDSIARVRTAVRWVKSSHSRSVGQTSNKDLCTDMPT